MEKNGSRWAPLKPKPSWTCEWSACAATLGSDRRDVSSQLARHRRCVLCCSGGAALTKGAVVFYSPECIWAREEDKHFCWVWLFLLFGDLISAEIETPSWPAATGGNEDGKVHSILTPSYTPQQPPWTAVHVCFRSQRMLCRGRRTLE